ncbi:MAG: hypothetical protein ACRDAM_08830, partial [Casimicrobium sp.]
EERQKLQQEANEAEARYMEERIGLLNALNGRLADATIKNIQDLTARQIAEEKARFEELRAERLADSRAQEAAQLEARSKLVEAYGATSKRVQEFDRQALTDTQARREAANKIEQQQLTAHLRTLEEIRNDATLRAAEQEAKRVQVGLDAIKRAYQIAASTSAIDLERSINDVLKSGLPQAKKDEIVLKLRLEADKSAIQQSSLQVFEEIERIQARLDEIANDATATTGSIAEYEQLTAQLDGLLLKREQNERAYTEIVNRESANRRNQWAGELQTALENSGAMVAAFDQFGRAFFEADMARISEREEANQSSISRIQEQLQTATGFQKQQLEQQLAQEKAKEQEIAKEKARLEKEEGRRAKAFAVIQSVINTARIGQTPPPLRPNFQGRFAGRPPTDFGGLQ